MTPTLPPQIVLSPKIPMYVMETFRNDKAKFGCANRFVFIIFQFTKGFHSTKFIYKRVVWCSPGSLCEIWDTAGYTKGSHAFKGMCV